MFWHSIWKSFGSPNVGIIANIRRSTCAKYHYSVKFLKRQDNTAADKLAHELLNNYANFWNDIKKHNKKVTKLPNSINNTSGDYSIAELFRKKCDNLYNCSTCCTVELQSTEQEITQGMSHSCVRGQCYYNHNVDVNCVSTSIKLVMGKCDGTCNITTDHLINGSGKLVVYLSLLFICMIKHSSVPSGF